MIQAPVMFSSDSAALATPCLIASSNPFSELAEISMVFAMLMTVPFRFDTLNVTSAYQLAAGFQLQNRPISSPNAA
jgi:hypothetical protein